MNKIARGSVIMVGDMPIIVNSISSGLFSNDITYHAYGFKSTNIDDIKKELSRILNFGATTPEEKAIHFQILLDATGKMQVWGKAPKRTCPVCNAVVSVVMLDPRLSGCCKCREKTSKDVKMVHSCGHEQIVSFSGDGWLEERIESRRYSNCSKCITLHSTLSRGNDRDVTSFSMPEQIEFLDRNVPFWKEADPENFEPGFGRDKEFMVKHWKKLKKLVDKS